RKSLLQIVRKSVVTIILFAHAPYARFLCESLGSILSQSYSSLDVAVLSDGSEAVAQAVSEFSPDSRVGVVCQGNEPFLQAANGIMKQERGEYLATWNSDDVYQRDHVKLLVHILEKIRPWARRSIIPSFSKMFRA